MNRTAVLTVFCLVAAIVGGQRVDAAPLNDEERAAMAQVQAALDQAWTQCRNGSQLHLMTRVVAPKPQPNPFAPALTPPGSQGSPGYYDLLMYPQNELGRGISYGAQQLTTADRLNGIEARYEVHLYVPAFRVFDPQVGHWSPWNSGSSWEKDHVNYVNYVVAKTNGAWHITGQYNIMTSGVFQAPPCSEVPG
jgi:hypothetical protein